VSVELANAIARRFIARADAKAVQVSNGDYIPHRVDPKRTDSATIPWSREDVLAHLDKSATYGHYLLDHDSTCKLFAFDIDLVDDGPMPAGPMPDPETATEQDLLSWEQAFIRGNLRDAWANRAHYSRTWIKTQFRMLAGQIASVVHAQLELECAVAYSGAKGLHVYGFTGRMPASDARDGAALVMEQMGGWEPVQKRASTFQHKNYPQFTVEVFPKQSELSGGGFGNLMRLPLGRNLKSPDPTFFVDMAAPVNELRPVDAMWALTEGATSPWSIPA
jgi:hypothetical protein